MIDNENMEWSAWRVWIHPREALDALDNADIMEKDLNRRLDEAQALVKSHKLEADRLSREMESLATRLEERDSQLAASHGELQALRNQLAALQSELAERKDVETQIREFDEKLKGVEDMKRGYERRIRDLEMRLRDAEVRRQRDDAGCELLEPGESLTDRRLPADDWLMELPEDL